MGRELRIDVEDGWHHLMNRGAARQATFSCDPDRVDFGRLIGVGHERFGVEVHAYCLMTNHFHLLVRCPLGGLSDFMHLVGSSYVRHANERSGRDGPLFRGRFRSIVVDDDRQLLATTRYIHRNALDLPGVTSVDDYRWSSHRTYLGHRQRPAWMRIDEVLGHFGGDRRAFHAFVADDEGGGVIERFGPRRAFDVDAIAPMVELALDECGDLLESAPQGVARTLMILFAARLPDSDRLALMAQLGFVDAMRISAATRRAMRRAASEPTLCLIVDRIVDLTA